MRPGLKRRSCTLNERSTTIFVRHRNHAGERRERGGAVTSAGSICESITRGSVEIHCTLLLLGVAHSGSDGTATDEISISPWSRLARNCTVCIVTSSRRRSVLTRTPQALPPTSHLEHSPWLSPSSINPAARGATHQGRRHRYRQCVSQTSVI